LHLHLRPLRKEKKFLITARLKNDRRFKLLIILFFTKNLQKSVVSVCKAAEMRQKYIFDLFKRKMWPFLKKASASLNFKKMVMRNYSFFRNGLIMSLNNLSDLDSHFHSWVKVIMPLNKNAYSCNETFIYVKFHKCLAQWEVLFYLN